MTKRMMMVVVAALIGLGLVSGVANAAITIGSINKTVVTASDTIAVDQPTAAGLKVDDYLISMANTDVTSGFVLNGSILGVNQTKTYGNWQGPNGQLTSQGIGFWKAGNACAALTGPTLTWDSGANSNIYVATGDAWGGGARAEFYLTADTTLRKLTAISYVGNQAGYGDGVGTIGVFEGNDNKNGGIEATSHVTRGANNATVMFDFTYQWDGFDSPTMYVVTTGGALYTSSGGYAGFNMIKTESAAPVQAPEPATLMLLGTGALGALGYIRRQRMS